MKGKASSLEQSVQWVESTEGPTSERIWSISIIWNIFSNSVCGKVRMYTQFNL